MATLEGVGFGLCDGMDAVDGCGIAAEEITLIGGGSRSAFWAQMLADISGRRLVRRQGGDVGPALGAARLARIGVAADSGDRASLSEICPVPPPLASYQPDPRRHAQYAKRREKFALLYQQLLPVFSA